MSVLIIKSTSGSSMSATAFRIDYNDKFSYSLINSFNEFVLASKLPSAFLNKKSHSLSKTLQCNLPNGVAGNSDITNPIIDDNCRIVVAGMLKENLFSKLAAQSKSRIQEIQSFELVLNFFVLHVFPSMLSMSTVAFVFLIHCCPISASRYESSKSTIER